MVRQSQFGGSQSRRTSEEERRDEATWLLADEVNWPDPELRRWEAEVLELPAQESHSRRDGQVSAGAGGCAATAGATGRSRRRLEALLLQLARQARVAGGWRRCCYSGGDGQEPRASGGAGATGTSRRRLCCYNGAWRLGGHGGGEEPGRGKTTIRDNFVFMLGVLWYISPFSPGRKFTPATTILERREYKFSPFDWLGT